MALHNIAHLLPRALGHLFSPVMTEKGQTVFCNHFLVFLVRYLSLLRAFERASCILHPSSFILLPVMNFGCDWERTVDSFHENLFDSTRRSYEVPREVSRLTLFRFVLLVGLLSYSESMMQLVWIWPRRRSSQRLLVLTFFIALVVMGQLQIFRTIDIETSNAAGFESKTKATVLQLPGVAESKWDGGVRLLEEQVPIRDDNNSTFSACLLVADDNHYLIEWLAFHFHTLPLRYLVIARDPRSRTSPKLILDRWEKYMTIVRWNDRRFLPKEWLHRVPAENDPTAKLMKHRERQRNFYPACFEFLKRAQRQWTLVIDVDEFAIQNRHYEYFHREHETVLEAILAQNQMSNTTCITMPRLRFGNFEDGNSTGRKLSPKEYQDRDFLTYRYRWRAGLHSRKENRHPKSMINVAKIGNFSRLDTDAHRPVRSECPRRNMYIMNRNSPFSVHHYVGSREQFLFRKDARDGTETRSEERLSSYGRIHTEYDDSACRWLPSFSQRMGPKIARKLLDGVGNVSFSSR